MTYFLPFVCLFLGSIVGCLLYGRGERSRIAQLEFENKKLLSEKEELEFRYEHEARSYIRHLDSHCCVRVIEDRVLEAEFVE